MYKDEEKKFDIRVVDKYIRERIVTRQEYEDYLKNLPDIASNIDKEYYLGFSPADEMRGVEPPLLETEEENTSS